MRNASWVLAMLLMAGALARGQEQPQTLPGSRPLKVTTEVVNIYAVVRGKDGRLIPDLNKDDFEVEEDGQPQVVRYFTRETDTPLTLGVLVDTSPSQGRVLRVEQREAEEFLREVVRPKDLIFVLHFDVEVELLQDFTADLNRLDHAIEETQINGGGGGPTPTTFPQTSGGATHLYEAVWLAARDLLQNEIGRKVVILLTDGEDQGSKTKLSDALEAAQKSDIIIYSINISDRAFYGMRGMGYSGDSVLKKLSEETGGRVIDANNPKKTSEAFAEIAKELRTQYLLGYTPANKKLDGTFRRIQVKVRDRNVKVSARRGYYAPEE